MSNKNKRCIEIGVKGHELTPAPKTPIFMILPPVFN